MVKLTIKTNMEEILGTTTTRFDEKIKEKDEPH